MNGLTDKQERFCQAYFKHPNVSRAYREVYGTPETKASTCYQNAYLLKKNPLVAARIDQLFNAWHKEIERQEEARWKAQEALIMANIQRRLRY